jgi:hypothetical protein
MYANNILCSRSRSRSAGIESTCTTLTILFFTYSVMYANNILCSRSRSRSAGIESTCTTLTILFFTDFHFVFTLFLIRYRVDAQLTAR